MSKSFDSCKDIKPYSKWTQISTDNRNYFTAIVLLLPWQTDSIADDPALYSADTPVDTSGQVWSARLHSLDAERLGAALRAVRDLNGPVAALALPDEPERTLEIR